MNMMNIKIKMTLYRRSTESFLIFENYIRSFLWGKLHPFKDRMVARASKSVNQFRDYIDIMTNQISHLRDIEIKGLKYSNSYSSEQLNHLIQQLSLIETTKTNSVNVVLTWVMCDGRNFPMRKQGLSHVTAHVKLIIVETFKNLAEFCQLKMYVVYIYLYLIMKNNNDNKNKIIDKLNIDNNKNIKDKNDKNKSIYINKNDNKNKNDNDAIKPIPLPLMTRGRSRYDISFHCADAATLPL